MRDPSLPLAVVLALAGVGCQLIVDEESLVWEGARDASMLPGGPDAGGPDCGGTTCADGAWCVNRVCIVACTSDAECPAGGTYCDRGTGRCAANCASSSDCTGTEPYCDGTSMRCVECIEDAHCLEADQACHAGGKPFVCGAPWVQAPNATGGTLRAVWVGPDGTAWAVGDKLNVMRCTATTGCSSQTVTGNTLNPDLLAVTGDGAGVWAAGSGGMIVRCNPDCSVYSKALAITLNGIALGSGQPWVATATGSIFKFASQTSYQKVYDGTRQLHALTAAGEDVLAVGADGTFVRCSTGLAPACASRSVGGPLDRHRGVAADGDYVWIVGQATDQGPGTAFQSDSGGTSWTTGPTTTALRSAVAGSILPMPSAWAVGGRLITRWTVAKGWTEPPLHEPGVGLNDSLQGVGASPDGIWVWAVGGKTVTGAAVVYLR